MRSSTLSKSGIQTEFEFDDEAHYAASQHQIHKAPKLTVTDSWDTF